MVLLGEVSDVHKDQSKKPIAYVDSLVYGSSAAARELPEVLVQWVSSIWGGKADLLRSMISSFIVRDGGGAYAFRDRLPAGPR
jgi:hypothetical protein